MKSKFFLAIGIVAILILFMGCTQNNATQPNNNNSGSEPTSNGNAPPVAVDRESKIPSNAVKMAPETDSSPPKSLSSEYSEPVPLPYPISTAGAEDSAFIMPDGKTLYFFFTPDVKVPVEKQIIDGVTGIYVSKKINGEWGKPERIILQDSGKLAGDGCEFVLGNTMWFCSAREGYTGMHWFTAEYKNGKWRDWKNSDFNPNFKVGELHITDNGQELYFHSEKEGGKGNLDIWVSKKINGKWQEPVNLETINTAANEGWPALSPDEKELWITKDYGLWRAKKISGEWQAPELMVSPLAGEASLDNQGNIYFTHHFFKDNKMIEADIYIAKKK